MQPQVHFVKNADYTAENYAAATAADCHLGLLVEPQSLSFAIVDPQQHQLLRFVQTPGESSFYGNDVLFYDWFRSFDELKRTYARVEIIWSGNKAQLVPTTLFAEGQEHLYLKHFHEREKNELYKSAPLDEQTTVVHTVSQSLYYALRSKFFDAVFTPVAQVNIRYSMGKITTHIGAFFQHNYFQLVFIEDNKLQFSNYFTYELPVEAVYHILNFYEVMQLSRERMALLHFGLQNQPEIREKLEQYLGNVQEATPVFSPPGVHLPDHYQLLNWQG